MEMLSNNVWLAVTNTLYSIHSVSNVRQMTEIVLKELNWFIPYDRAMFFFKKDLCNEEFDEPVTINFEPLYVNRFREGTARYDSARGLKYGGSSLVYRESDFIESSIWKKTSFYAEICQPNNIEYILQIILCINAECLGNIYLFRNNNTPNAVDFSEKDVFIMNLMKDHLALGLHRLLNEKQIHRQKKEMQKLVKNNTFNPQIIDENIKEYDLTERETEIFNLIIYGNSTEKICDILSIAPSTLKKHTSNMYRKLGVNSRTELFRLIRANPRQAINRLTAL